MAKPNNQNYLVWLHLPPACLSDATFYDGKSKYGGMSVPDAKRLKSLEDENRRLKMLVADLMLDKDIL